MMGGVDLLAVPFRLTPAGRIATVPSGSDAEAAQAIVVLLGTVRGERELVPDFGMPTPLFADGSVDAALLNAQLGLFGPPDVHVDDVELGPAGQVMDVTVTFASGAQGVLAGSEV